MTDRTAKTPSELVALHGARCTDGSQACQTHYASVQATDASLLYSLSCAYDSNTEAEAIDEGRVPPSSKEDLQFLPAWRRRACNGLPKLRHMRERLFLSEHGDILRPATYTSISATVSTPPTLALDLSFLADPRPPSFLSIAISCGRSESASSCFHLATHIQFLLHCSLRANNAKTTLRPCRHDQLLALQRHHSHGPIKLPCMFVAGIATDFQKVKNRSLWLSL